MPVETLNYNKYLKLHKLIANNETSCMHKKKPRHYRRGSF